MSILYLAAIASAVTLVPTSSDEPRQARAQFEDLNLSTSAGRDTLDRRVKLAVNKVCGRKFGQPLEYQVKIRKCQKQAMAEIIPQRELAIAKSGVKLASK